MFRLANLRYINVINNNNNNNNNTHTHTQPFYGSLDFVWDYLGEPVPEETFTHSHPSLPISYFKILYHIIIIIIIIINDIYIAQVRKSKHD